MVIFDHFWLFFQAEVDKSVQRLFYWASYADKYGGTVQETQLYGTVIKIHEPVGVIGIYYLLVLNTVFP